MKSGGGELRRRIAFHVRQAIPDNRGNYEGAWEEKFRAYAKVTPLKGGEEVLGARLSGVQPVIIRVRYSSSTKFVQPHWKAIDTRSGAVYNVTSVANLDEKNIYLDFMATTGVPV